jgi:GNAT superfamily N-acetyltransferase
VLQTTPEIYEYRQAEVDDSWFEWSSLWYGDFEEAGIEHCYLAFRGNNVVGFQTVDCDGCCIALEVHPDYQGQGIASALIEETGCYRPACNENPEFWAVMEEKYA